MAPRVCCARSRRDVTSIVLSIKGHAHTDYGVDNPGPYNEGILYKNI